MKEHKEYYAQSKYLIAPKAEDIPLPDFINNIDNSNGDSSKISYSNREEFFKLLCQYHKPYNEAK